MKLTAALAIRFGTMKAKLKAMELACKLLCDQIKDELVLRNLDEFAPVGSPFKLVKSEYDRTECDYKDMAMKAYRQLFGRAWRAKFNEDVKAYGKKHIIELEAKPNENWSGEVKAA